MDRINPAQDYHRALRPARTLIRCAAPLRTDADPDIKLAVGDSTAKVHCGRARSSTAEQGTHNPLVPGSNPGGPNGLRQTDDPSAARGAAASAENAVFDQDLETVIERWQSLPEAVRAGILAMVQATKAP